MKIILRQLVKLEGDRFPHSWSKTYESNIKPTVGDKIEDPIWKDPYEYEVKEVVINYAVGECYVAIEEYNITVPENRKDDFVNMAHSHGWKTSWEKKYSI